MPIVVTGSEGNIGRRLKAALPDVVGIDRVAGADVVVDLATVDYRNLAMQTALRTADALVHLATNANADAKEAVHWDAVATAARLMAACAEAEVPRVVLASSDWAEPKNGLTINAYGWSKRAIEAMAAMYDLVPDRTAVALRVGWVPQSGEEVADAAAWLRDAYWDDGRLIAAFQEALGLV